MYSSILEKIECKMLFTWVRKTARVACYSSAAISSTNRFCLIWLGIVSALFNCFGIVSFVATVFDKLQFGSKIRLSQINEVVRIRLKFKFFAVSSDWGSMINFLFVGRHDIVINWDFSSKISRNFHKRLVPKLASHDYWEVLVKISRRDQLVCFENFVGMTLLALLFLLPEPN